MSRFISKIALILTSLLPLYIDSAAAFDAFAHIFGSDSIANSSDPCVCWGAAARQGIRPEMEDEYAVAERLQSNRHLKFFGLYDGHGGRAAAQAVATGAKHVRALHDVLALSRKPTLHEQLEDAFKSTEESLLNRLDISSGTTAVTAVVNHAEKLITIAHVGDSRAIIMREDTVYETEDHKPTAPHERTRIRKAGDTITIKYGHTSYVNGRIAMSRALGDREIKMGSNPVKSLSAQPEISQLSYTDKQHVVLVLASDGVWDVFSSKQAAKIIAHALNSTPSETPALGQREIECVSGNDDTALYAATKLRDAAYAAGSDDNISVIVACINKTTAGPATSFKSKKIPTVSGKMLSVDDSIFLTDEDTFDSSFSKSDPELALDSSYDTPDRRFSSPDEIVISSSYADGPSPDALHQLIFNCSQ